MSLPAILLISLSALVSLCTVIVSMVLDRKRTKDDAQYLYDKDLELRELLSEALGSPTVVNSKQRRD